MDRFVILRVSLSYFGKAVIGRLEVRFPGTSSQHVEVTLEKIINLKLL